MDKSFGEQANQDAIHLQEGATIYVSGAIQTREVARTTVCANCGEEYIWKDTASEIVPYSVEYLEGCLFPEREMRQGRRQKQMKRIGINCSTITKQRDTPNERVRSTV